MAKKITLRARFHESFHQKKEKNMLSLSILQKNKDAHEVKEKKEKLISSKYLQQFSTKWINSKKYLPIKTE